MAYDFNGSADDYASWQRAVLDCIETMCGTRMSTADLEDVYDCYTMGLCPEQTAELFLGIE